MIWSRAKADSGSDEVRWVHRGVPWRPRAPRARDPARPEGWGAPASCWGVARRRLRSVGVGRRWRGSGCGLGPGTGAGIAALVSDVSEDAIDDGRPQDEGDDPHLRAAGGAAEGIDVVDAAQELGPAETDLSMRQMRRGGIGRVGCSGGTGVRRIRRRMPRRTGQRAEPQTPATVPLRRVRKRSKANYV